MKFSLTVLLVLLFGFSSFSQSQWSLHTSFEETIHLGDNRSSFNMLDIHNFASLWGAQIGLHKTLDDQWSGQITLGFTQTSQVGNFYTNFIPVEFTARYNALNSIAYIDSDKRRLNFDLSIGTSLTRPMSESYNRNGDYQFTEFAGLGTSFDIAVTESSYLTIGYRHAFYFSDLVDATPSPGLLSDHAARLFVGYRTPLGGKLIGSRKNDLERAQQKIAELESAALKAKTSIADSTALFQKQIELDETLAQLKAAEEEIKVLQKQNQGLKDIILEQPVSKPKQSEELAPDFSGYAVVIGSFTNERSAREFMRRFQHSQLLPNNNGRYRVAYTITHSKAQANSTVSDLKRQGQSSWILKL